MSDQPINVSEDRLRGVLAEMELRLRDFFDGRLKEKADRSSLEKAEKHLEDVERTASKRDEAQEARIASLEKWRYGLTLLAAVAIGIASYGLKLYTHS